jgi:hypothetical protein
MRTIDESCTSHGPRGYWARYFEGEPGRRAARNYVQRVMENLQVYCARFGASTAAVEPNLHRAAPVGWQANPVSGYSLN